MTRRRINLNREWRFTRGDPPRAQETGHDDSTWEPVGLPHTFDLPYFRTPEFYVGLGWYRKRFDLQAHGWLSVGLPGRRAFLEFEGAFQTAEVFVNGTHVGGHRGGYTGFQIDITDHMRAGDNLLAVRVDNNWDARLAPRAGEHLFSGGLYRDVDLVITDPLHVTWHGTGVTTPVVSRESAVANVKTELCNDGPSDAHCTLLTRVLDPAGAAVAEMQSTRAVPAGQTVEFDQTTPPIPNPQLWHTNHPHLYRVVSQVYNGDALVDEYESPLGFRWFEWTADRGFFLNGEHLYLRGVNAHQDHAGWGIGITQAAIRRDVKLIKQAGFNFIRGAHYPHHPMFAQACDELGVICWSENCFWGKGGFGPEGYWNASAYPVNPGDFGPFEDHCKQTLREMIRINRNHPSIVVWSMTNEAFFTYNLDRAGQLMRELVALSRQADPTRPAAIGGAQRGDVDKLGDVAGYNGDGARLFIDPGVPNMVSEYGAINKPHAAFDPFYHELQTEQFPWRGGQAIWCGFDYGTIAGRQGLKGIVDHQRLPKQSWYWYRNEQLKIPPPTWPTEGDPRRLRLSADKTTIQGTDATDDVQVVVTICDASGTHIDDCLPVTLAIESGPGEFPTGPSITFDAETDIKLVAGQAAIAFRSYHGGTTVIRATAAGLEDATIQITTEGEPCFVPGQTPPVRPRPYVPPAPSEAALRAMANIVNVALNRPCRASSEGPDHPARLGNDGDASSFWSADDDDAEPWWTLDLEGFYQLSGLKITFPAEGNWRFAVQTSVDNHVWLPTVDRRETTNTAAVRNDIFPPGTVARFVRLDFTALPPARGASLSEVEVYGVLSVR